DRRIGLNEIVIRSRAYRAGLGADNAERHRVPEPEGVADGEDMLADTESIARSEHGRGKPLRAFDLEEGEIDFRIAPDYFGSELALVSELDADLVGAIDDVFVRNDIAARIDDEAGTQCSLLELARLGRAHAAGPEEELERVHVGGEPLCTEQVRRRDVYDE